MSLWYGLDFPKYLPILHLVHILNVWLLWMLARQLNVPPLAATAGVLFFAFNMAVFDVYWKPMYVFDLFCATFTLASILLYTRRRYVLSFCAFWLAYKSKELAVMLPVALACYELWLADKKKWAPLIPFLAVSLSFGLQAVMVNVNIDNDYTFHFTPNAFWTCLSFYSSQILLAPHAGLALLALPLIVRDRRLWFGCAILCLFFAPLLFLPGRLYSAYCYLPLAGVAIMAAVLASLSRFRLLALGAAFWLFANFLELREKRTDALVAAAENRAYVEALADFARASKDTRVFVYDGMSATMHVWGIEGALRYLYHRSPELHSITESRSLELLRRSDVALLRWKADEKSLAVYASGSAAPVRLLGDGWYQREEGFRWIAPHASATLTPPVGARDFQIIVNIPAMQLSQTGPIELAVSLNGTDAKKRRFTESGVNTWRWPASLSGAAPVNMRSRCDAGVPAAERRHPRTGAGCEGAGIQMNGLLLGLALLNVALVAAPLVVAILSSRRLRRCFRSPTPRRPRRPGCRPRRPRSLSP